MHDTIGIDVSKDKLDAVHLAKREHRQFANDRRGLRSLRRWIESSETALVVLEASGVYHRLLEDSLSAAGVPFSKVNPRQARRFAEATGKLAKTDKVDAEMLAKMGSVLELGAQAPKAEYLNDLRELMTARRGVIKDRVTVRTRMQVITTMLLKRHLKERLAQIEKHLEQVDCAIMKMISGEDDLRARFEILVSIPGISTVTAFSMLIEMPELGSMSGKQAACLAGLAPISRQSGKWQGKERIQGGRAVFRRAMYMPALCTIRHDLSSKRKHDQLVDAGKPPKVALTAIMRKLVILANSLLRDGRKWSECRP